MCWAQGACGPGESEPCFSMPGWFEECAVEGNFSCLRIFAAALGLIFVATLFLAAVNGIAYHSLLTSLLRP